MTEPQYDFYLCGPMRGMPNYNVMTFSNVAQSLRQYNYRVANPASSFGGDMSRPLEDYVLEDVKLIAQSQALMLLPGWEGSVGARAEVFVAIWLNKRFHAWEGYKPDPEFGCRFGWHELEVSQVYRAIVEVLAPRTASVPASAVVQATTDSRTASSATASCATSKIEQVYVDPATGGRKGQKPQRYDLIPVEPLEALAEVYGYGAQKYDPDNWRRGYPWSLNVAALYRHIEAWRKGERLDPESGLPHLAHAAWHLFTLQWFELHSVGVDDRRDA